MLTAEIKVNGRLVSVVTIQNVGGDSGPELKGVADYEVFLKQPVAGIAGRNGSRSNTRGDILVNVAQPVEIKQWDRSRPAHELVHAAIEAIMESSK